MTSSRVSVVADADMFFCSSTGSRKRCACPLRRRLHVVRAQVDPDKAFAVQVAHEEGVLTTSAAYMQCALLYTSSNGERRIRRAPVR